MTNPLVSFIITCYNFEKYIEQSIRSLLFLRSDYSFEIIVIDDASTDHSAELILNIQDPRIIFIHHKINKGVSCSVNEGFDLARGNYICRFDGDDYWYPDFLEKTIPILEENPKVGMVYGDVTLIDSENTILSLNNNVNRPKFLPEIGNEFFYIFKEYYIPAPSIIARKEAWKTGFPIPSTYSFLDWYLSLSIARKWDFFYIDSPLAYYRIHVNNMRHIMIKDRTGEETTRKVLDLFLSSPQLSAKQRKEIVREANFILAEKYFGVNMYKDAKRCYISAFRTDFSLIFNKNFIKHFSGTMMGFKKYNQLKEWIKKRILF